MKDRFPELKADAEKGRHDLIHAIADLDEKIGDKFLLEQPITNDELSAAIRRATIGLKFTPADAPLYQSPVAWGK